jgi:superfamily II DNA/RNA helicase/DNA replication protein DnaC
MPRIFDNINDTLLKYLQDTLGNSYKADICVGFFNLRGWASIDANVDKWNGWDGSCARVLVGMQKLPQEELRAALKANPDVMLDNKTAARLKVECAQQFKDQLVIGIPTNRDEAALRKLSAQIKDKKVIVKLHLPFPLHAKLYLMHKEDANVPIVGVLGSSNLTMSGMERQGELNIDVLDSDACKKLQQWFEDRWNHNYCVDISAELAEIIDNSWARETELPPYHIYLKIAYHLSQEARAGLNEFKIPRIFRDKLFAFQQAAVLIAAKKLYNRSGVFIGDVVGLGKTFTACAVAKIFEEDYYYSTLIVCPANLVEMWQSYIEDYDLKAQVMSVGMAPKELKKTKRFRLVILDESQNLRNDKGERYKAIKDYIRENDSKVILLSATPYNKEFIDLSSQLRLFVPDDLDLGISPEHYINKINGYQQFAINYPDIPIRSIRAFEKSEEIQDWRDLTRLFMIRRTRYFIKHHYAKSDVESRYYLEFPNGDRSYFPVRVPKKLEYKLTEDSSDQYARLYNEQVVDKINDLIVPRYGLAKYFDAGQRHTLTNEEALIEQNLTRAGQRLIGFCRTNLFKRLESSGYSYLLSICRHIQRNYIFIYAIENDLPLPIGKNYSETVSSYLDWDDRDNYEDDYETSQVIVFSSDPAYYISRAKESYAHFQSPKVCKRFGWIRSNLFTDKLLENLQKDTDNLLSVVEDNPQWDPAQDRQLNALYNLLHSEHPDEKVLIFTQYADTANYLYDQLGRMGIDHLGVATGASDNPTELARQFSPVSHKLHPTKNDLRILIATDVLSEGQNLQDCHIMLNYDLPWAIIRLIQRAGRIDRIGQQAREILCYNVLPEKGVEKILRLRDRLRQRISQNAEVFGSDDVFFAGDPTNIRDLYNEKTGIFDEDEKDTEIDLGSYAYQIWKEALEKDKSLERTISSLPNVVYSSKAEEKRSSVVVYARTATDNDVLAQIDLHGNLVSQAQKEILDAAKCEPDTLALPRMEKHHNLVAEGIKLINTTERDTSGTLGRKTSIKYQAYTKLDNYIKQQEGTIFVSDALKKAVEAIYRFPLKEYAKELISRNLRTKDTIENLVRLVESLWEEGKLCLEEDNTAMNQEPQIICSMGFIAPRDAK